MKEHLLRLFSQCAARYFTQAAHSPATIGTPFLQDAEAPTGHDYSAVIGITGRCRGSIVVSAPTALLIDLLPAIGEDEADDRLCSDLVGEMANTISGNAREELGASFMISTPVCFSGTPSIYLPRQTECYVIPIDWQHHRAHLLIALAEPHDE